MKMSEKKVGKKRKRVSEDDGERAAKKKKVERLRRKVLKESRGICEFSKIDDDIFISSGAFTRKQIGHHRVKAVVNCAEELSGGAFRECVNLEGLDYLELQMEDRATLESRDKFKEATKFIEKAVSENKKVLVHCVNGISRSPAIVASYLMKKNGWTWDQAIREVRSKRPQANPLVFEVQLENYGNTLFK